MLPAARHQFARLHSEDASLQIGCFDLDGRLPPYRTTNVWQAETPFLLSLERALDTDESRIDVHNAALPLLVIFALCHKDAERLAHLGRRKSIAIFLMHDVDHLLGQIANSPVNCSDWLGTPPQHRIWMQHKGTHDVEV